MIDQQPALPAADMGAHAHPMTPKKPSLAAFYLTRLFPYLIRKMKKKEEEEEEEEEEEGKCRAVRMRTPLHRSCRLTCVVRRHDKKWQA